MATIHTFYSHIALKLAAGSGFRIYLIFKSSQIKNLVILVEQGFEWDMGVKFTNPCHPPFRTLPCQG